jgi:methylenetetrahydrofolate dehydrogenase (NADP+) / methenyltetrahydrofolate cyclohydrolase
MHTATAMDGRLVARMMQTELAAEIGGLEQAWRARHPWWKQGADDEFLLSVAVIILGENPTSLSYVRILTRSCASVGLRCKVRWLPADAPQEQLEHEIRQMNLAPDVIGIILQTPLPRHINTAQAVALLRPDKDVDGLHPLNAGRLAWALPCISPATPLGGIEVLRRYDVSIVGKHAVVVGRSNVVGRPMSLLLLAANATVTTCHTRTVDLGAYTCQADILVSAAGHPGLITGEMIKPGAAVVDFGTNVTEDGGIVGDVEAASAAKVAGYLTPVPGGTGPITNMALLRNAFTAARLQLGLADFVLDGSDSKG